jgi:hypothetical protein
MIANSSIYPFALSSSKGSEPIVTQSQKKGRRNDSDERQITRSAHKSSILFSVNRARRDVRAGIVGAAAEAEQIDEYFLAIFECGGFEQRLFFGGMKRK